MYYDICPNCGAHLDPGEPCDCREEKRRAEERYDSMLIVGESNQLQMNLGEVYEKTGA